MSHILTAALKTVKRLDTKQRFGIIRNNLRLHRKIQEYKARAVVFYESSGILDSYKLPRYCKVFQAEIPAFRITRLD